MFSLLWLSLFLDQNFPQTKRQAENVREVGKNHRDLTPSAKIPSRLGFSVWLNPSEVCVSQGLGTPRVLESRLQQPLIWKWWLPALENHCHPKESFIHSFIHSAFTSTEHARCPSTDSEVKAARSCPTPCNPGNYTVHGILQARTLECACIAFPFSRGSSQPRDRTHVTCIAGGFFTSWATKASPRCT